MPQNSPQHLDIIAGMVLAGDVDVKPFGEGLLSAGLEAFADGEDAGPGEGEGAGEAPVRGVEAGAG